MDGKTSDEIACLHKLREKKWSDTYRNRHVHQHAIFCTGRPRRFVVVTVVCMIRVKKCKHSNPEDLSIQETNYQHKRHNIPEDPNVL